MDPIQTVNEDYIVDEQRVTKLACECLWVARPIHWLNDLAPFISVKLCMIQVHAAARSQITVDMDVQESLWVAKVANNKKIRKQIIIECYYIIPFV